MSAGVLAVACAAHTGAPRELGEEESGESYRARRKAIENGLPDPSYQPGVDVPLFTELMASGDKGIVTIPLPNDGGQCLPIFSTPLRAADYKQTQVASGPAAQYLSSTATQLLDMLRDLRCRPHVRSRPLSAMFHFHDDMDQFSKDAVRFNNFVDHPQGDRVGAHGTLTQLRTEPSPCRKA